MTAITALLVIGLSGKTLKILPKRGNHWNRNTQFWIAKERPSLQESNEKFLRFETCCRQTSPLPTEKRQPIWIAEPWNTFLQDVVNAPATAQFKSKLSSQPPPWAILFSFLSLCPSLSGTETGFIFAIEIIWIIRVVSDFSTRPVISRGRCRPIKQVPELEWHLFCWPHKRRKGKVDQGRVWTQTVKPEEMSVAKQLAQGIKDSASCLVFVIGEW